MTLNQLTISQCQEGLKAKQFSAVELVKACLDRIETTEAKLRALISVFPERALDQAEKADRQLAKKGAADPPLLGIPFSAKDLYNTIDDLTTAGSNILNNYQAVYESTVTRKLKEAGAILLGKSNLDAFGHGSSTEASDFMVTKNPWDLHKLPGGSSGGSAANVAADQTIFSVGTETAGSLRQPAAWCGVVGLSPTYGRVSRYGVIAFVSSLDKPGPLTKDVADAAGLLRLIAGQDELDATSAPEPVPDYPLQLGGDLKGLKVGLAVDYFVEGMENGVARAVRAAAEKMAELGAVVKEVSLFKPRYAVAVYTIVQRSETSSNLARYDGIRYGNRRETFGNEAKKRILLGTHTLSAGYYDRYYQKAQRVRTLICRDFERVFSQVDLVVGPVSPTTALPVGAGVEAAMFGELQDILVEPSALAGLPSISVPGGFSEKMPVGLQIIGPRFSEARVLRAAYAYEQATEWHRRKPDLTVATGKESPKRVQREK